MMVFPGVIPGIPAYTVKLNAKLPNATPSVRGLIALIETDTGRLLAVMDSMRITAVRTAVMGALSAEVLARRDIETVGVIGAGTQGREQLRALKLVRSFRHVRIHDVLPDRAKRLAERVPEMVGARVTVAATVAEAVQDADVVITATWSTTPFLHAAMIAKGVHIIAVGADEPGKAELSADLIRRSVLVCDDVDLAVRMGALAGVGLGRDMARGSLSDVLAGNCGGRASADEITVFASVGLAYQDLAAAWTVYNAAVSTSSRFDFIG